MQEGKARNEWHPPGAGHLHASAGHTHGTHMAGMAPTRTWSMATLPFRLRAAAVHLAVPPSSALTCPRGVMCIQCAQAGGVQQVCSGQGCTQQCPMLGIVARPCPWVCPGLLENMACWVSLPLHTAGQCRWPHGQHPVYLLCAAARTASSK